MLNPEQYIKTCIVNYPTLYAGKRTSYNEAKLKIMNQLLNVIGNGVKNDEELIEQLSMEDRSNEYGDKYFEQDIYYTSEKAREEGAPFSVLAEDKDKFELKCTANDWMGEEWVKVYKEKGLSVDKLYKPMKANKKYEWNPYPNFSEEFSTIYQCPKFLELERDWILIAIWFYEKCLEFFHGDHSSYSGAFPHKTEKETKIRMKSQLKYFMNCKTYNEASEKWKHPFNGDVEEFLTTKWQKELDRICSFILNTINKLGTKL